MARRQPKPKAPTATDFVASIQRGQPAAQSLSHAGGRNLVETQLTPQALAAMSDAPFEAIVNQLQAEGDREKLMDLFGR